MVFCMEKARAGLVMAHSYKESFVKIIFTVELGGKFTRTVVLRREPGWMVICMEKARAS